jgi:hypothetical protein
MKRFILKSALMSFTIAILADVVPLSERLTGAGDIGKRGGIVSHDAPTDPRGCHRGPDGVLHCH